MGEKSHVSMATTICPICGKEEETGEILLHKHMKAVLDRHTPTGYKPCAEHTTDIKKGYVYLLATESETKPIENLTGTTLRMERSVAERLFAEDPSTFEYGIVFVEPKVIEWIMSANNEPEGEFYA